MPPAGAYQGSAIVDSSTLFFRFPSAAINDAGGNLLVAQLGTSQSNPPGYDGSVSLYNTSGVFVSSFTGPAANGGFGASQLAFNPVPEPTTVLGIAAAGLGLTRCVRRRRETA
jgi:hypothetical protein